MGNKMEKLIVKVNDDYTEFSYENENDSSLCISNLFTDELLYEIEKYENIKLMWMSNIPIQKLNKNIVKLYLYECLEFNQPLNLQDFTKLKECRICSELFMQSLHNLPTTLEKLSIHSEAVYTYSICNLPENIKSLDLHLSPPENGINLIIPSNLEELSIGWNYNFNNIPNSIKKLSLLSINQIPIEKLPNNLETIKFGYHYRRINPENYEKILKLIKEFENQQHQNINIEFYDGDILPEGF